jgi:uncharacterized membrane protein YhaH (DUF805 family)
MVKLTDNAFLFSFKGRINRAKYWYALFASMAFSLVVMSFLALTLAGLFGVGVKSVSVKLAGVFSLPPSLPFQATFSGADPQSGGTLISLLFNLAGTPVLIFSLWFLAATTVKRLHDRDKNAWWLLLFLVAPTLLGSISTAMDESIAANLIGLDAVVLNLWGIAELLFLKGTSGPNRFGSDPLAPADPIDTRPPWDQGRELEFVPHKAGPLAGAHVMRGHD